MTTYRVTTTTGATHEVEADAYDQDGPTARFWRAGAPEAGDATPPPPTTIVDDVAAVEEVPDA